LHHVHVRATIRASAAKRISLIDGAALARLRVPRDIGVRTRTTYALEKVAKDYFTGSDPPRTGSSQTP
jgi:restriction endonuclease Mrr